MIANRDALGSVLEGTWVTSSGATLRVLSSPGEAGPAEAGSAKGVLGDVFSPAEAGEKASLDPMGLLTKAVLLLPGLVHHASQSHEAAPTNPWGTDKMKYTGDWMTAKERKLKELNRKVDKVLWMVIPPVYIFLWVCIIAGYFANPAN